MVSDSEDPSVVVLSTGRVLAGRKQIAAAITRAQVYWRDWWRRPSSFAPQRGQEPHSSAPMGRDSKPQVSQDTSPACAAVSTVGVIAAAPPPAPRAVLAVSPPQPPTPPAARPRAGRT